METKKNIKELIVEELIKQYPNNKQEVENFGSMVYKNSEIKKGNNYVNYWYRDSQGNVKQPSVFIDMFNKVKNMGLWLDLIHITIQKTGLSFDYVAYKNLMLITYPETMIDIQLVSDGDEYSFSKDSGKVVYSHTLKDAFTSSKDKKIIGGYCVIKNKRGEFLTTLNKDDFDKHKKTAKGTFIWDAWYDEMCLKTLIKKACKYHFQDIFEEVINIDNEENDIKKGTEKILEENKKEMANHLNYKYIENEDI